MTTLPFFSVIVPTHKRALLLRRALESIKSQVCPVECEVIVISDVEDSATDAVCIELLAKSDIYIRRNGENGPSSSRNLGLSLVKGRFVMFLDDDDAWHPNCLANLLAQPHVQLNMPVYFNCTVVNERRLAQGPELLSEVELHLQHSLTSEVYIKNQVHMSCFAFPRQLLQGIEFDPFMRAYEDWDYLLAVFSRAMPTYVPLLGSRVFEVKDTTTDRRGSSEQAKDFNAVLDYLYVYRRHPAPTPELKQKRAELLKMAGLPIDQDML
jgi:glycosyltransferase involved in cell wall biosynthesis